MTTLQNATTKLQSLHFSEELSNFLKTSKEYAFRHFRGKALSAYLKPFETRGLTDLQKSVLIGTLLGDSTLQYNKGKFPWYKFDQQAKNKSYVNLIYSIFSDFVGTPPSIRYKDQKEHSLWFRTYRSVLFDFYARQFYIIDEFGKRKKTIPKLIHRWLNPIVLAFWFMDDGSKTLHGYVFHTQGFVLSDIKILQKALGRVFRLQTNIQADHRPNGSLYTLYVPASEVKQFNAIVSPFIVDCMKYKLLETEDHKIL